MSVAFPALRIGEPVRHNNLSVFPLFAEASRTVVYRLSHDALAQGSATVEEVSEAGSVPALLVENKGEVRVLFLEGEELVGAKQNRVLNTSVLVAAHSKLKIPVSCVEQGRWRYKSKYFTSSGSHSPSKLRRTLKASVSRSLKDGRGYSSNQGEVWMEVAALQASQGVTSGTSAMSDTFAADVRAEYARRLKYVEGASGLAVAVGNKVVTVDLFDKAATCRKVWERLLSGQVFDAREAGASGEEATVADVERILAAAGDLAWDRADAVGEGEEYRAQSPRGDHVSALVFDQTLVHGSLVAAP